MQLRNRKTNTSVNGNMADQFRQFKSQLVASGKNPNQVLNDLLSSGKVSKAQLDNATRMANMFSYLIK